MAFDAFLKIDGIPGESRDEKHKDWVEILSYRFGVRQPSRAWEVFSGKAVAERCDIQDFSISKTVDRASPLLFQACCTAKKLKEVTLVLCRATGKKEPYFEVKLSDVIVESVLPNGRSGSAEGLPTEDVAFTFRQIEIAYSLTDQQTGKPKGQAKAFWKLTS